MLAWVIAVMAGWSGAFIVRFFAGFCLIANGAYIAGGSVAGVGDAIVMLRNGSSDWHLWVFGAVTVPAGLALWHNQGRMFGFGPRPEPVWAWHAGVAVATSVSLIMLGLIFANC
jgi:hypothetical protein